MERERASEKALAYITSLDMLLDNTNVRRVRQQEQERVRLIGIKTCPDFMPGSTLTPVWTWPSNLIPVLDSSALSPARQFSTLLVRMSFSPGLSKLQQEHPHRRSNSLEQPRR